MFKIRKKILLLGSIIFLGGCLTLNIGVSAFQRQVDQILTTNENDIISPPKENAVREGAYDVLHGESGSTKVGNLIATEKKFEKQEDAEKEVIKIIKKIINYALGLVSFITLIVLIFSGFQMVTAGGDDEKHKTGLKNLKKAGIALAGISVSWMIITLIFWVLNQVLPS